MMKGKFIVIYGANNVGKTTQVGLLKQSLLEKNIPVELIKYPVYKLQPTGPLINSVLREGKQMPEEEFQKLYVQNRKDFEPQLRSWLDAGTWVIAEDYVGTGIAWGMVRDLSLPFLEEINAGLLQADMAILLDGERFETGRETNNRNEIDDALWHKAKDIHVTLGDRYGWNKLNANQTKEAVHAEIVKIITQ